MVRIAPKEEVLRFGEEKDGWFSILDNSGTVIGYVSTQIAKASTARPLELLSNAKIRKDPKADGAVVKIITKGDKLYYSEEKDGWFAIVNGLGAVVGFVSNQVAKGADAPAAPVSAAPETTAVAAPVSAPVPVADSSGKKGDSSVAANPVVPPPAILPAADSAAVLANSPDSLKKDSSIVLQPDSQNTVAAAPVAVDTAVEPPPPPEVYHHPDSVVTRDSSYVVPGQAVVNDSAPVFSLPERKSAVLRTAVKGDTLVFLNTVPIVVRKELPAVFPTEQTVAVASDSAQKDSTTKDSTAAKPADTLQPVTAAAAIPQVGYDTLYFMNVADTGASQWVQLSDVSIVARPETLHVALYDTLNGDSLFAADSMARLMAAADSVQKAAPKSFMARMKAYAAKGKLYVLTHRRQSIIAGGAVVTAVVLAAALGGGSSGAGGTTDGGGGDGGQKMIDPPNMPLPGSGN